MRDCKENWALKNWCCWTVVLEKTLESPLDCKEIQPVNPKGNQSWIFIGRTDAEAEASVLWPPDAKNWLSGKDHDAGKDWRQEEKGMTEDEKVGWHHWLNEPEFAQALGVGDGQGSLAAVHGISKSWTQQSNWSELTDVSLPLRWKSPNYTSILPEVHQILSESFIVVCDSSLMPMANPGFSSGLGALPLPNC